MTRRITMNLDKMSKIALEVASAIGNFSNPEVFRGYYQAAIGIELFNNKEEYDDFYKLLTEYMDAVKKSDMFKTSKDLTPDITSPVIEAFNAMRSKYPKATDVFILEAVYDIRKPDYTTEALAYILSKNIVSYRVVERTIQGNFKYNAMSMITSNNIRYYLKGAGKSKETQKKQLIGFLESSGLRKIFPSIKFDEFCVFAKDESAIKSLLFTMYSLYCMINTNKEQITPELLAAIYNDFIRYIIGEIENIDIEKLKLLFCHIFFSQYRQIKNLNLEDLKSLEKDMQSFESALGNVTINMPEQIIGIQNPTSIKLTKVSSLTGRPIDSSENKSFNMNFSTNNVNSSDNQLGILHTKFKSLPDFPVLVVEEQDFEQIPIQISEMSISMKMIIQEMRAFINSKKMNLMINSIESQEPISEQFKEIKFEDELIKLLKSEVDARTKARADEQRKGVNQLDDLGLNVLTRLIQEKKFGINEALVFDSELFCTALANGKITYDMIQFTRIRSDLVESRKRLIEIAFSNSNLYDALVLSGNITKRDIYDLDLSSYVKLVETFFNANKLNADEIAELFKVGKISILDIENMNLENVSMDDSDIVSIYCEIQQKRNEYEEYIRRKNADAEERGIAEEDVPITEDEIRLQTELQDLINKKNVYITLYNKQKLTSLVRFHRTTDIYNEIVETFWTTADFEKNISNITNMLYEDGMISMAQIRSFGDNLVIDILKSGHARLEDIEQFKEEIVTIDERKEIQEELQKELDGEELEEAIRVEVYKRTYNKLYELMKNVVKDGKTSKEEKISILFALFSKNTLTEQTHRKFFESEILVKIYSKIRKKIIKPIIDPTDQPPNLEDEIELEEETKASPKTSKQYVYHTNVIWEFMKLLDPDCKFTILSDGYVIFESKKLKKVFIENVWHANKEGDFVRRGYGAVTLILDLDVFKKNQADIIKLGRHGYKVDVTRAKEYLPKVPIKDGKFKTEGAIVHEKDLQKVGKKIWFELILEHLGITQKNIDNKETNYTQDDLDAIIDFITKYRNRHEEVTK